MAKPGSSWAAHEQETSDYGSDRLQGATLTITAGGLPENANGWKTFQVLAETTFTAATDANNSTGLTAASYPVGTYFYTLTGTVTISSGDVILHRRPV